MSAIRHEGGALSLTARVIAPRVLAPTLLAAA